jgi:flagellar secretion chaperone FliS
MTPCYQAYRKSAITSAETKEQLLLMLYDGALQFTHIARMGIAQQMPKVRGENISKVLAILTELDAALDRSSGGELAKNLSGLYGYMINRLTQANLQNDAAALDEVAHLLAEIREGFAAAAPQPGGGPSAPRPGDHPATRGALELCRLTRTTFS